MSEIILYTIIVGVFGTGLGGFIGSLFRSDSNKAMSLLLSFAGGIMLSIVFFDLMPASIESSGTLVTVILSMFGVLIIFLLNYLLDNLDRFSIHRGEKKLKFHGELDELHHSSQLISEIKKDTNKALLRSGIMMVLAIALHNFPEGLSIGSSYTYDENTGLVLAFLIAIHNIPEGMAIGVPLIIGGMKRRNAVFLTSLSGAPTILGAIIGYWIGGLGNLGMTISLSLASGAMIYIVFGEILPQSILMYKSKLPVFFILFGIFTGILLSAIL